MRDVLADALNAPPGRLAEIILKKLTKGSDTSEPTDDVRRRLDRLIDAPGEAGKLARIRLAADVPYLFERAPEWTETRILPLFDWSSADAADAWVSRKYGKLHRIAGALRPHQEAVPRNVWTKRRCVGRLRGTFADWLTLILYRNRSGKNDLYSLSATEARAVLRRAVRRRCPALGIA